MIPLSGLRQPKLFGIWFILALVLVLVSSLIIRVHPIAQGPSRIAFNSGMFSQITKLFEESRLHPHYPVYKGILRNGLTVLLREVHTTPVVSVQVWYQVGVRNESTELNGISHQLEHLMFKGTRQRPIQFGQLFSALGSQSDAFTSYDHTAYINTAARHNLEALLMLEADRMQQLQINQAALTREKQVVISELEGYENSPDYRLNQAVMQAALPNHLYGLPIVGSKTKVEQFTVEQVQRYYQTHYTPSHAVLVITGDFETASTLKLIERIFGSIPGPQSKTQQGIQSPPIAQRQNFAQVPPIILKESGKVPLLEVVYSLPNLTHPDVAAISVLATVLAEGRSSRLYQALIKPGFASAIESTPLHFMEAGWYQLMITATDGTALTKLDQVLQQTLEALQTHPISSQELARAQAKLQASLMLQNADITSQGMLLGEDAVTTGDAAYTDRLLTAITQVTVEDVQRVAQQYLGKDQRVIGRFEPISIPNHAELASDPNTPIAPVVETFQVAPPNPAAIARYLPKLPTSHPYKARSLPEEFVLPNGLKTLLFVDRSTPSVTLSGYILAGNEFDPEAQAGLANLTAQSLMDGTTSQDALTLNSKLEDQGTELTFRANREGVLINGQTLTANLPSLLQILADISQHASFPEASLELNRERIITQLKQDLDDPNVVAQRVLQQTIYPVGHPLHSFPTLDTLHRLKREAVVRFYQQHYRPDTTVLTIVGNFNPTQVKTLIRQHFGHWQPQGTAPDLPFPPVSLPKRGVQLFTPLEAKSQSITYIGKRGIHRRDKRFYAALVLNQIVGSDPLSSRLGAEIRDREGLTYDISSDFLAGRAAGPFLIQLQTSPATLQQAIAQVIALLKQLRAQGVTAAEVLAAKQTIVNQYQVELANPDRLAETILMNAVYGLPRSELEEFADRILAVNPASVNRVIRELIDPDRLIVATAGSTVSKSHYP